MRAARDDTAITHGRCHLAIRSGNRQAVRVGRPFTAQLRVRLTDEAARPVPGATVTFRIVAGPAGFGRAARAATAVTDRSGVAIAPLLGAGRGHGTVTVTVTANQVGARAVPVTFTLRVVPES